MKKLLFSIPFALLPISGIAQTEHSPARRAGVCYSALLMQSPQPSSEREKRSEYQRHKNSWDTAFGACQKQGVNPANSTSFRSCMSSKGASYETIEYMIGFTNSTNYFKNNRVSNFDIGAVALEYCRF